MKKLPETKKKNGFIYRLIKRTLNTAMYSQESDNVSAIIGYEVFKVRQRILNIPGAKNQKIEHFPSNSDFGKTAWAYSTFEMAEKKYLKLERRIKNESK